MSLDWIDREIEKLADAKLLRQPVSRSGKLGARIVVDGARYINFASNDYLGIASDPKLEQIVAKTVLRGGWGSGASPLIVGRSAMHAELERRLATFLDREAALLFPTGFAANVGTIPALVGKQDIIFSDAKNHASIIDGCRLSGATIVVYPHGDAEALSKLIAEQPRSGKALIVTDSLFSMDGDVAPLEQLSAIADRFDAMLLVDEAHAIGVMGPNGRGAVAAAEVNSSVDVIVGTLSKSFGSHGGFVAGSKRLIDFLTNRARSYVFSTASPVAAAAIGLAALGIMRDEPERRERLLESADRLRNQLRERGWNVGASAYHIVPIIVGEAEMAIELSARLRNCGYWVPCIRPPTVPQGESCLRISLSSFHSAAMIDGLLQSLDSAVQPSSPPIDDARQAGHDTGHNTDNN